MKFLRRLTVATGVGAIFIAISCNPRSSDMASSTALPILTSMTSCELPSSVSLTDPIPVTAAPTSILGDSCQSSDPTHLCIAIKYVAFEDITGTPTITEQEAIKNVRVINSIWSQCNLGFQVENYESLDPSTIGVKYNISTYEDLETIRKALNEDSSFLIVTTGKWDRAGSLGQTQANAWTSLPCGSPYGAIMEQPVATYSNIIAHELGHYLNLSHVSERADLMDAIIYSGSTQITSEQCSIARAAANYWWQSTLR